MKKLIISTLAVLISGLFFEASAQQEPMISQYMFNGLFLNPGYAGSHPYATGTALYRKQWIDVEGAPETALIGFDMPLPRTRVGLGFLVANDKIGVSNKTDVYANYAYHLPVGQSSNLSFGLRGGISFYRARLDKLIYWDVDDPVFQSNVKNNFMPNFGFGLYYYTPRMYAGVSVPNLVNYDPNTRFYISREEYPNLIRHLYGTGGIVFDLNEYLMLKPSFLIKYVPAAPLEWDINLNLFINRLLWVGASYRTEDAIIGIVELQATPQFRIGFAYDYTLSKISKYTSGTYEIMVGYDFGSDRLKLKSPRYF